jgi:hypothetical protein
MVDATMMNRSPANAGGDAPDDRLREERRRYTTQLQRRAQAHVTAELGQAAGEEDIDRQVTMLVQHALETTGARRVTLLRPVPRGRRWHVATVLEDGCFYYGLVAPETLVLSRAACTTKMPVLINADTPNDPALPTLSELGMKTYLGVPIVISGTAIAVVEAIDVAQPESLERYAIALEQAVTALATKLASENHRDVWNRSDGSGRGLTEQSILDLVLRPQVENDDAIEISPAEWSILNQLDGERPLGQVAQSAGMAFGQASSMASALIDRGLARVGRENRRRV